VKKILLTTFAAIAVIMLSAAWIANYSPSSTTHADSSGAEWKITITGLVQNPLNLSLTEIRAMPSTTETATLYCVDQPTTPRAQGNWTGVKLSVLLENAGVLTTAVKVGFYAADGYTTDLTLERALKDDIILAYANNGAPLSETLRLVVPGHWGYKWIAQVTKIELVNYNFLGIWESNGYSDEADTSGSGRNSPPVYKDFPSAPKFPAISSPTIPFSPSPSPTPELTPSPSQSQFSTAAPTVAPPASTSPTYAATAEPDSSSGEQSAFSVFPYVLALGALAAAFSASTMVLWKRKRHGA
jgi:hypothetical protein